MTDFGELATLGNRLQEAELEIARLRSELVDTTTELRHARDEELDAEFYQSQIDDVREFFLCWRGDEGDEMMKFADSVLAMLRSVVVPDWHASDDRLDKQTILGDRLRLAMAFGRELAESQRLDRCRVLYLQRAIVEIDEMNYDESDEALSLLIGMFPQTPDPKQCPPIPGVDQ